MAQRRRRVFVVASARADFDPAAVLFEFDGVRRDTAPSREAGQDPAKCITARSGSGGGFDLESETPVVANTIAARTHDAIDVQSGTFIPTPIAFHPTQDPISSDDGTTHGLGCGSSGGRASVAVAQAVSENQRSELRLTDFTYAITSGGGKPGQGYPAALVPAHQYIGGVDYENNAHTMDQPTGPLLKGSPTGGGRPLPAIATAMQVRRLTPVECERLQGFPDNYTNIPWRKKEESPDGPRYKALGNSWAVPNVRWISKRIQEALNAPA